MKIAEELAKVCSEAFTPVSPDDWNDEEESACPECGAQVDEPVGKSKLYRCSDCGWKGKNPDMVENDTVPGRF